MGYYTRFELTVSGETKVPERLINEAEKYGYKISPIVDHEEGISNLVGYYPFDGDVKWYDHDKDMKKYSLQFPDIIFTLHGEGEDAGDLWVKYYKNGKVQECKAKIIFDSFDESALK